MFASTLGTWIPFGLIFVSTWLTGLLVRARHHRLQRFASDSGDAGVAK
jgi:hypothetical protein